MEVIAIPRAKKSTKQLQIIPLGGVMEIGKNMTAYVYKDEILVVDAGLMFPEEEMLGVDIVIPDITYLEENAEKIKGIVLTHGHEDHIGALPYVLRRLDVPVWGSSLTLGFLRNKLEEHRMLETARLNDVEPGSVLEIGQFKVEFVRVGHSIPDACCLLITTGAGTVVHSSDFKFDQTPIDGKLADIPRLARAGEEGVLALLCDSTNVEKEGFTPSESIVGESFDKIFASASGRIIIAAFASNIHRAQQVYNIAAKYGRRVAVIGRSMEANSRIAEELGYLVIPDGTRLLVAELDEVAPSETVIITTGSQGEPLSALSRMAVDEHKHIKIVEDDTVIISARPIPGNEDLVLRTVNRLFSQGADVIYEPYMPVHVSGHGNREDVRLMLNLLRPKYIIPAHGEQRHFAKFAGLAADLGYSSEQIVRMTPGDVLETDGDSAQLGERVAAGSVMVDGLGVGDVKDLVLRDRRHLALDGVIFAVVGIEMSSGHIVSGPDIVSKGFVGEDLGEEIMEDAREVVTTKLQDFVGGESEAIIDDLKAGCKKALAKFIYERTHRRPMVVPVVMEV